jgi:TonB family protein
MLLSTDTDHSVTIAAIVVFATLATNAQTPPPQSASLTPGAVALLANSGDSAAVERAVAALSHDDPTVRAVAARVLGIGRVRGAIPKLRSTLEGERDEAVAAELFRALLYFSDPENVSTVEARLPTAPWSAVESYLSWLITSRPDDAAERLERLFKARPREDFAHASALVVRSVTRLSKERDRALRGLLATEGPSAWRAVLDALGSDIAAADGAVMQQALASANEAIRRETVWALVARLSKSEAIPANVLDAALPAKEPIAAEAATSIGWEAFGRELVARRHRQVRTPDRSHVIRSEGASHQSDTRLLLPLQETLPAERDAASELLGERNVAKAPPTPAPEPSPESNPRRGQLAVRTIEVPWPGLFPDLVKLTGCPVTTTLRIGMFEISYRPDGRPQAVGMVPAELPPECAPALAALARLTIADPLYSIVDGEKQYVVVLISSEHLACLGADGPTPPRRESERVTPGRIKQPTKTRDVRPRYPPAAQDARVQGMVVAEALLSAAGCVTKVKVLRSVHPLLDFEAVRAVSQWRFTPTRVNGVAVPVIMTVTVNFTLE